MTRFDRRFLAFAVVMWVLLAAFALIAAGIMIWKAFLT